MTDPGLAAIWMAVLAGGVGATVLARRLGLPSTHARDLLHVGAGVWVLGWPWWDGTLAPLALVGGAVVAVALVPVLARRSRAVDRFRRSVVGGDEVYGGLVVYSVSFAVMTGLGLAGIPWLGLAPHPFPAAAALWALALGDGLGGLVGRRYGWLSYATRWGKRKTVVGSVAVAVFAGLGAWAAAAWLGAAVPAWQFPVLGAAAAAAEGLAPRSSDNLVVPVVVFAVAVALA